MLHALAVFGWNTSLGYYSPNTVQYILFKLWNRMHYVTVLRHMLCLLLTCFSLMLEIANIAFVSWYTGNEEVKSSNLAHVVNHLGIPCILCPVYIVYTENNTSKLYWTQPFSITLFFRISEHSWGTKHVLPNHCIMFYNFVKILFLFLHYMT